MVGRGQKRVGVVLTALCACAAIALLTASPAAAVYVVQAAWGGYGSGAGRLHEPGAIATDATGDVYVLDRALHRVEKFTTGGRFEAQWGSRGSRPGQFGDFSGYGGIATDAAGDVYVSDTGNARVEKFSGAGVFEGQWGKYGSGKGRFMDPEGVAVDAAGNVYVVDVSNLWVQKFTATGAFEARWRLPGTVDSLYGSIAIGPAGDVYVVQGGPSRIEKFTATGTLEARWAAPSTAEGGIDGGVATDAGGNVYAADSYGSVLKFTSTGTYVTEWGYGHFDLRGGGYKYSSPLGVATDAAGNVYVSDLGLSLVERAADVMLRPPPAGTFYTPIPGDPAAARLRLPLPPGPWTPTAANADKFTIPGDPCRPALLVSVLESNGNYRISTLGSRRSVRAFRRELIRAFSRRGVRLRHVTVRPSRVPIETATGTPSGGRFAYAFGFDTTTPAAVYRALAVDDGRSTGEASLFPLQVVGSVGSLSPTCVAELHATVAPLVNNLIASATLVLAG